MMLFMACFVAYMVRVNISVNILAMVVPDNKTGEAEDPPDVRQYNLFFFLKSKINIFYFSKHGPRYNWDGHEQGLILGAYFWGYLTTSLFGGTMSEWFGGRYVIFVSFLLSGILTALSAPLAGISFWYMFAVRYLIGFVGVSFLFFPFY